MSEFNDPYARLDQMRGMFERTQGRVQEMQDRIAELSVVTEDEDARLTVAVGSSGVQRLSIDPKAMRLGSEELSERLTALIHRGTEEMQAEVKRITDELVSEIQAPPSALHEDR